MLLVGSWQLLPNSKVVNWIIKLCSGLTKIWARNNWIGLTLLFLQVGNRKVEQLTDLKILGTPAKGKFFKSLVQPLDRA